MKQLLIFLFLLTLSGCGMPNDEIISESKKCEDAGMGTRVGRNGLGVILTIQCDPSDNPRTTR